MARTIPECPATFIPNRIDDGHADYLFEPL
jgi:hypothetical protein